MGTLKFGIVGFFILLPFLFVSYVEASQYKQRERYRDYIERSIEEASYDAAFALKTYSEAYYDSRDAYHIQIPYEDVVNIFFDSLNFREFLYQKEDFFMLVFVTYDGIVIYDPKEDHFLPKSFYAREVGDMIIYYTLSDQMRAVHGDTLLNFYDTEFLESCLPQKEACILQVLENQLNRMSQYLSLKNNIEFNLPVFEKGALNIATNDLSFLAFYESDDNFGMGLVQMYSIVPSGVMKKDISY